MDLSLGLNINHPAVNAAAYFQAGPPPGFSNLIDDLGNDLIDDEGNELIAQD